LTDLDEAVRAAAAGDVAAFAQLVGATQAELVRLAARLLGNLADAEDVVQDAYVKAYRALQDGSFDGRAQVRTWLYRIVVNTGLDALRSRKRRPLARSSAPELSWDGAVGAEAKLALNELADWTQDLPLEQRAALTLTALEGLSNAEAAQILGVSEGAIEQRLVRARATLRARNEDA
jgi:RNA polymerase sigma-70 factor, ECF subfamily